MAEAKINAGWLKQSLRKLVLYALTDDLMEAVGDMLMTRVALAKHTAKTLRFFKSRDVKSPERGTGLAAGLDFFLPDDFFMEVAGPGDTTVRVPELYIPAGGSALVPSGVHVQFPSRYVLIAFNKSGIASKRKLLIGAQVIDADYEGEVHINLHNTGREAQVFKPGDKLTQFILLDVALLSAEEASSLANLYAGQQSERGSGGFGSTGA